MKTLYIFLLSCFSAFVIHAQNLSIDSISLHTQEATLCDADTIYIYFRTSVNFTPVGGARVMVNFPSNYSPQGNGLLNLFPVAGPFFPIAPNFLSGNSYTYPFGTLGPNESYVMKVPFVASCGAQSASLSVNLLNGVNTPLLFSNVPTPFLSLFNPQLKLTGNQNTSLLNEATYVNGDPIYLDSINPGLPFVRRFTVDLQTVYGGVKNLMIKVDASNFNVLGVSNGATISSSGGFTTYLFDTADMGGELNASNNTFTFEDTIIANFTCGTGLTMTSFVEATVDCGSGIGCSSITPASVFPYGKIIQPKGELAMVDERSGYIDGTGTEVVAGQYQPCQTNFREITIKNISTDSDTLLGSIFDFILNIDFGEVPNGITSSAISFDSVLVDGQNLPLNPVSKIVDLTGYVGNGLRDLDLDGERDDILAGDSLIIKIYFNTPLNTFVGCEAYDIANNIQDQFLPVNNNVQFKPSYATYCKNEQLIFNDAGAERAFHFRISKHPSDFDYPITHLRDGETLPVTVTEWNSIGNFDRSKILVERTFVVPKGLYLVSSSDSWAGVGGGFYTVNTLPGVETDTIVFLTTRFPSGNKTTLSFDLILDCDSVAYECSRISTLTNPLHRTLQFTSRALVYDDLGNLCGSYDNMCRQGPGVSWNCDTIISDVEFVEFGAERATFGWTDTTMTTRVTRDSAGVVLNQAYNYDSIRFFSKIAVLDTASVFYHRIRYWHPFGMDNLGPGNGFDPLQQMSNIGKVSITDVSSGITGEFMINNFSSVVKNHAIGTGISTYMIDLRDYIDSMRLLPGVSPNFIYGGEEGSPFMEADTVEVEMFFSSNGSQREFVFNSRASYIRDINESSDSCSQNNGGFQDFGDFFIRQYEIDLRSRILGADGYCSDFFVEVGNSPVGATFNSNNFGNAEYKPTGVIDQYVISWSPGDLILIEDSTLFTNFNFWPSQGGFDTLIPPSAYYVSPTRDTMIIYADQLPDRLDGFSKGRKGFGILFRGGCNLNDASSIKIEAYGRDYVMGHNAPSIVNPFETNTLSFSGTSFDVEVVPLNPEGNISTDSVCWDVIVRNPDSESIYNAFFSMKSLAGTAAPILNVDEISSGSVSQTLSSFNNPNYGIGQYIYLDTIFGMQEYIFKICASNPCKPDSIELVVGYNCQGAPNPTTLQYGNPAYSCFDNYKRDTLTQLIPVPIIEQRTVSFPSSSVDFCDTLTYTFNVTNSGLVSAHDLIGVLNQVGTGSVLDFVPGSSTIEWMNFNPGVQYPLADPTLNGNGDFVWNFGNQLLGGDSIADVSQTQYNTFNLTFKFTLGCPITIDDQFLFELFYEYDDGICNDSVSNLALPPLVINGIPLAVSNDFDINFELSTAQICDSASVTVKLEHSNGFSNLGNEVIVLEVDSNFRMLEEVKNFTGDISLLSDTAASVYFSNDKIVYEWQIDTSSVGDSLMFDVVVYPKNFDSILCVDSLEVFAIIAEKYELLCSIDSTQTCPSYLGIDTASDKIEITKLDLIVFGNSYSTSGCDSSLTYDFSIYNGGLDTIQPGTRIIFDIVTDVNCNGVLDAGDSALLTDSIIFSSQIAPMDSIPVTDSIPFTFNINDTCDKFIVLSTTENCICSIGNITFSNDNYEQYNLELIASQTYVSSCDSLIDYSLQVYNASSLVVDSGTSFTYSIYNDANCNGMYDSLILYDTIVIDTVLMPFDTIDITQTNPIIISLEDTCGIMFVIDSIPNCFYLTTQNMVQNLVTYDTCVDSTADTTINPIDTTIYDSIKVYEFFSPNGDGINDTWIIAGLEQYPDCEIKIYNRYGTLVYTDILIQNPWDGTPNVNVQVGGRNVLPSGVYYYIVDLNDDDNTILNGYVVLSAD